MGGGLASVALSGWGLSGQLLVDEGLAYVSLADGGPSSLDWLAVLMDGILRVRGGGQGTGGRGSG